jgi:hypothetical protein
MKSLSELAGAERGCSAEIDRLQRRMERVQAKRAGVLLACFDAAGLASVLETASELQAGLEYLKQALEDSTVIERVRAEAKKLDATARTASGRRMPIRAARPEDQSAA